MRVKLAVSPKGKRKGSRNERRVCRDLSLLVSNGERDDLLWRSAMSGGTATTRAKRGVKAAALAGDVSSIDIDSHWLVRNWYIEVKHYADLQILRGFTHNSGKLHRFWLKTVQEAAYYGKQPMLLAKQDRLPELLIVKRGQKIHGHYKTPILTVRAWEADIYLFKAVEKLTEKKPERVLIDDV